MVCVRVWVCERSEERSGSERVFGWVAGSVGPAGEERSGWVCAEDSWEEEEDRTERRM